jgi:hypothetical protein
LEILNFPDAVEELRTFIGVARQVVTQAPTPLNWSNFKTLIRDRSHRILRMHRRVRQKAATQAETAAASAKDRLEANTDPTQHAAFLAAAQLTAAAALRAWQDLLTPAELAAKILDHQFGDQSSFYFFRAVKLPDPPTTITALNRPGRAPDQDPAPADLHTSTGRDLALQYARDFYSSDSLIGLFRPRPIDAPAQTAALGAIRTHLPGHLQHLAEGVDGDSLLTQEEMKLALASAGRGSCPGADGLPYEFYRFFKDELLPPLLTVFNTAFQADLQPPVGAQPPPSGHYMPVAKAGTAYRRAFGLPTHHAA